ncbi:hypothetical protein [Acidianus ambivalens]|nr:hypothetical protein [Acidianus ambivalens]
MYTLSPKHKIASFPACNVTDPITVENFSTLEGLKDNSLAILAGIAIS